MSLEKADTFPGGRPLTETATANDTRAGADKWSLGVWLYST